MNKALQIISIQYELALALSEASDLKRMLRLFLRTCNSRLNLSESHIFLYKKKKSKLRHFLSLPKTSNKERNNMLNLSVSDFLMSSHQSEITDQGSSKQYLFEIPHHGVLVFFCKNALISDLEHIINPILKRLSLSCKSAIDRDKIIKEIKARKKAEEKIYFQANHDHLTGLYNRRHITKLIKKSIKKTENKKTSGAIVFISINNLKNINEMKGHNAGDKAVAEFSKRLKKICPKIFPIARFGGNDFIILIDNMKKDLIDDTIKRIIDNTNKIIDRPFIISGSTYSLSCHIGYDTFKDGKKTASTLIQNSDLAMHEAKSSDTLNHLKYKTEMSDRLDQKSLYEVELKEAIKKNEFELHYQPQYNESGQIIGTEALLRWDNPNRGYESPAIYIPIAERSDLIIKISEWVLNRACEDIRELEKLNLPSHFKKTAINISAKHIARDDFKETITTAINKHGIDPEHFSLEITEGIMMGNVAQSIEVLNELKKMGVQCSIDDFGTGYSSLSYLKKLPADVVKIDRAFVQDINVDKDNQAIANMIIDLGKNLNMDVIAEGVETQKELDCLKNLGCNQYQGYFFCKPIPFDDLVELLIFNYPQQHKSQESPGLSRPH